MDATESPTRTGARRVTRGLRSAYVALLWTSAFFAFVYVAGAWLGYVATEGVAQPGGPLLWLWFLSLLVLGVELVRRAATGTVRG